MAGVHQSYRDVFVTNNPDLLKSGHTDKLAVNQLGIFSYDPKKDQVALAAPNYAFDKAIQLIQGTPETPTNLLAAIANQSDRSKPIKGRKIINFTGKAATRGQNQILALGFDGVDVTKTLSAQCEESKTVFLKLSGGPIDQAFHTEGKGYVRQYSIFSGCCDDCGDDCAQTSALAMAEDLVRQVNEDPIFSLGAKNNSFIGGFRGNRFIRAKVVVPTDELPTPDSECQEYLLNICDNGDDNALGQVQSSQYPAFSGITEAPVVRRIARNASNSTYQVIVPEGEGAPIPFSNAGLTIISDCPDCPAGYTALEAGFVVSIQRADAGDASALTDVEDDYSEATVYSVSRVNYQYGTSTYVLVASVEAVAVGSDIVVPLGQTRNSCVITTPTSTAWVAGEVYNRFNKVYNITLKDDVCGENKLAALQAAYPDLTIAITTAGECVNIYSAEVPSNCVLPDCPPDAPQWNAPQDYYGAKWTAAVPDAATYPVGVVFESAYVDLVTNECSFDYWRYDAEPVIIEVSQHSQDYNDKPTVCAGEWPVTEIQSVKLPTGTGQQVRDTEAFFKGYRREYRDLNPIVRDLQNAVLTADPNKFYDQYTLEFEFQFHQSWFSETLTDTYRLEIYVPEGTGKQIEAAINGYITTARLDIDPVVL